MEKTPIRDLIDRWATRKQLADEIGASLASVHKWAKFNRIPANWQASVIRAAQAQGFSDITAEWMVSSHAQEPQRKAG
ncbi:MAG: hypothetical protein RI571_06480 [Roseovarius sp.]|nr:hypothetical protein [Roseovarius sp.]